MKRQFWYDSLILSAVLVSFLGFLLYTEAVRTSVGEALSLCVRVLVPSLFPCMVMAAFLAESGASSVAGRLFDRSMRFLFGVPGEGIASLLPGLAAGYPVGARTAILLYKCGRCSKEETERLLAFSNNAGPAFVFGAVGIGMFGSGLVGGVLYFSHVLASFAVGILFRFWKRGERPSDSRVSEGREKVTAAAAFTKSVKNSALSVLNVTAFVAFFAAAVRVLFESGFIPALANGIEWMTGIPARRLEALLAGLLEMTGGLSLVAKGGMPQKSALMAAAFLLGWAGVSVHFQVLSFLEENRPSMLPYFAGKVLHGGLSALIAAYLQRYIPVAEKAFAAAWMLDRMQGENGGFLFWVPIGSTVILGLFLLIVYRAKKRL